MTELSTPTCLLPATPAAATRRYQAIWLELKANRICTIEAHPTMHPKIKHMVIKEKYKDKEFRRQWLETPIAIRQEPDTLVILYSGNHMIFKLMPLSHAVAAGYRKKKYRVDML